MSTKDDKVLVDVYEVATGTWVRMLSKPLKKVRAVTPPKSAPRNRLYGADKRATKPRTK